MHCSSVYLPYGLMEVFLATQLPQHSEQRDQHIYQTAFCIWIVKMSAVVSTFDEVEIIIKSQPIDLRSHGKSTIETFSSDQGKKIE